MKSTAGKFTFKIADPCPWYSVHSPGTVSGNFMERNVPVDVPANSILPECDMATAVRIISLASTVRKTCNGNKNTNTLLFSLAVWFVICIPNKCCMPHLRIGHFLQRLIWAHSESCLSVRGYGYTCITARFENTLADSFSSKCVPFVHCTIHSWKSTTEKIRSHTYSSILLYILKRLAEKLVQFPYLGNEMLRKLLRNLCREAPNAMYLPQDTILLSSELHITARTFPLWPFRLDTISNVIVE